MEYSGKYVIRATIISPFNDEIYLNIIKIVAIGLPHVFQGKDTYNIYLSGGSIMRATYPAYEDMIKYFHGSVY